jgi:hypothetical protein
VPSRRPAVVDPTLETFVITWKSGWATEILMSEDLYYKAHDPHNKNLTQDRQTIIDLFLLECRRKYLDDPREDIEWGSFLIVTPKEPHPRHPPFRRRPAHHQPPLF